MARGSGKEGPERGDADIDRRIRPSPAVTLRFLRIRGHVFPAAYINRCEKAACTSQMLSGALIFERPGRWSLIHSHGSYALSYFHSHLVCLLRTV
jgi:hypothetical protein